jgi:hypothetical protein
MHYAEYILIGIGGVLLLLLLWIIALSGGDGHRLSVAFRGFVRALREPGFAQKVESLLTKAEPGQKRFSAEPIRLLAVLQQKGRLVDFLMEDIRTATPDQIAAAVRDIHPQCQETLKKHVALAPVLARPEGETVDIPAGYDPSAVRLVGNVSGQPPFRGSLQHAGWRVTEINLPPVPEGLDETVLMPAEVEIP